jgi:hypothetical protein
LIPRQGLIPATSQELLVWGARAALYQLAANIKKARRVLKRAASNLAEESLIANRTDH